MKLLTNGDKYLLKNHVVQWQSFALTGSVTEASSEVLRALPRSTALSRVRDNICQNTQRHVTKYINPLTQELNSSAQRCLMSFLLGILLLEPYISLIYAWKNNKCNNYLFSLLYHATRHNTPIHNILSTAPQLSISQNALETLPEDGNVMPKHVADTIRN
jgi:hypothetical protein